MSQPVLGTTVQNELNDLFLGERIGSGIGREVYVYALDPSKVVKIEIATDRRFQNVCEWQLWNGTEFGHALLRAWLAPCFHISHSGSVLIQARTYPLATLPARVPGCFTDLKPSNWGQIDGHPVCHDYGINLALDRGLGQSKRLLKADWGEK